jgi:two-component system chemotaxis response regulator CheB
MPKGFTKSLSDRLNELSEVTVVEAEEGDVLQKGYVYVAPGGKQMRIVHNADGTHSIKVTDEAPREGLRPCANIMYESLLDSSYDDIICVVLTGMGSDGTNGIEKLSKEKNVYVISQDAQTSVVYGMPRAVNNAGLSDEVLPLDKISESIIKNVGVLSDGR